TKEELTIDNVKYPVYAIDSEYDSCNKLFYIGFSLSNPSVVNNDIMFNSWNFNLSNANAGATFTVGDGGGFSSYINDLPDFGYAGEAKSGTIKILEINKSKQTMKVQFIDCIYKKTGSTTDRTLNGTVSFTYEEENY
ncbi:hypothetical protein LJC29_08050, partial [Bacteroides sp. OttesenSCG-928-N06]|nr:hypothetical protein [Bacteroides sp. OttesenSCG-928-N06]